MTPRTARIALVSMLVAALPACGGGAPDAMGPPPAAPPSESLSTAEGALTALDSAEAQLQRALGGAPAQPGYAQAPPPPPQGQYPQKQAPPPTVSADQPQGLASGDPCSTACAALASMQRATEHLCGLAGEGDGRCDSARTRVKSATARVHAACPGCAAGSR